MSDTAPSSLSNYDLSEAIALIDRQIKLLKEKRVATRVYDIRKKRLLIDRAVNLSIAAQILERDQSNHNRKKQQ